MALSFEDVERVAQLARIAVTDEETRATQASLNGIFELIAQMQSVDVSAIEPMSHAQDVTQRLRPDRVIETDQRAAFQAGAPQVEAGLYLVPQVIESE